MSTGDAKSVMWLGLAFLFVVGGAGFAYAMWRLGRTLRGFDRELHRTIDEVVPVIGKSGTSLDTVNVQLAKVDMMLDSAVDMTESMDTAVRAVSMAVTEPVKKASGAIAGVSEAITSFRSRVAEPGDDASADAPTGRQHASAQGGDDDAPAGSGDQPDAASVTAAVRAARMRSRWSSSARKDAPAESGGADFFEGVGDEA